jgi:hypothetical protein
VILEKRRQPTARNKTGFVDGGREDRASVFPVPHGIVGAPAKERNAKWSACNYHLLAFRENATSDAGQLRRGVRHN